MIARNQSTQNRTEGELPLRVGAVSEAAARVRVRHAAWLAGWLADWLAGWLAGWRAGWLAG